MRGSDGYDFTSGTQIEMHLSARLWRNCFFHGSSMDSTTRIPKCTSLAPPTSMKRVDGQVTSALKNQSRRNWRKKIPKIPLPTFTRNPLPFFFPVISVSSTQQSLKTATSSPLSQPSKCPPGSSSANSPNKKSKPANEASRSSVVSCTKCRAQERSTRQTNRDIHGIWRPVERIPRLPLTEWSFRRSERGKETVRRLLWARRYMQRLRR
jgi:hypothetical protein